MRHVGFTGSRSGMTEYQKDRFLELFSKFWHKSAGLVCFHHGDCLGADTEAHKIVKDIIGKQNIVIYPGHPYNPFREPWRGYNEAGVVQKSKPFLVRNKNIVKQSDIVIATPKERTEILRSGTWATIRYAKKNKTHVIIIYPEGEVKEW